MHLNVHSIKRGSKFFKVIELLTQLKRWVEGRLWATFQIVTFKTSDVVDEISVIDKIIFYVGYFCLFISQQTKTDEDIQCSTDGR